MPAFYPKLTVAEYYSLAQLGYQHATTVAAYAQAFKRQITLGFLAVVGRSIEPGNSALFC